MLPLHHHDPFDRLLIWQALTEQIPILSTEEVFDQYSVKRQWLISTNYQQNLPTVKFYSLF
jgi:PIN domain nuclease of toxin-antitoxin system